MTLPRQKELTDHYNDNAHYRRPGGVKLIGMPLILKQDLKQTHTFVLYGPQNETRLHN